MLPWPASVRTGNLWVGRYGMIEAVAHRKTLHSLRSPEVQGSSDAAMMPRTTSHMASSPFLRQLRLVTIQLRLLRLNRLMRRLKSQGAEE